MDLSGLNDFSNFDSESGESVLLLKLDVIEPDPYQPRKEFDEEKLKELAASIKAKGRVLTPISVRDNPSKYGAYIINNGERRYRASIIAGQEDIYAVINNDFDSLDQLTDNIQRENLSDRDIAVAVSKLVEQGIQKKDVAKKLGVPASYVSDYVMWSVMPEQIRALYDEGRCTNMRLLARLARAEKNWSKPVLDFCRSANEFTGPVIDRMIAELKQQEENDSKRSEQAYNNVSDVNNASKHSLPEYEDYASPDVEPLETNKDGTEDTPSLDQLSETSHEQKGDIPNQDEMSSVGAAYSSSDPDRQDNKIPDLDAEAVKGSHKYELQKDLTDLAVIEDMLLQWAKSNAKDSEAIVLGVAAIRQACDDILAGHK